MLGKYALRMVSQRAIPFLGGALILLAANAAQAQSIDETSAVQSAQAYPTGFLPRPIEETEGPGSGGGRSNPTELFSSREGFDANGHWKPAFEAQLWLYLPATSASIGLNRPPGTDVTINRPRPTIADFVNHVAFAFDCDCRVRYGDLSAEVSVLYLDTKQKTTVPALPSGLPPVQINNKLSVVYVSPGLGYRVLRYDLVSVDLRAGFTYSEISTDAEFVAGEFSTGRSYSPSLIQPWLGGRVEFFPSPRWRVETDAAGTGIGGPGGWNAKVAASYLITRWFDVTLGYRASETRDDREPRPDGAQRGIRVLLHGPMVAFGVRF